MNMTMAKAALAAVIGLGTLSAIPATAMADGIYFEIESGRTIYRNEPVRDHGWDRHDSDRRDFNRRDRRDWRDDFGRGRGCRERQALRKAWRLGLEDPQIVRETPRRVVVEGIGRHGRLYRVDFANVPGCPALR